MEADPEFKNLPLDEKVVHKQWKVRVDGYTECAKYFATITDPKSQEFLKFAGLIKKFVTDSHASALEKALEAVLVFVNEAHIAGKTAGEATSGIITKCLAAPRKTTQDKALEVILMYVEIERQEAVEEELIKGFSQKNPKVVVGCIKSVTEALREFGNKVILIKPLVKTIGPLLDNRDKSVREEAKKMVIEMYRWVKDALKPQLTSLKPIQVTELEAEFAKLGSEKATPNRLLRSQQAQVEQQQNEPTEETDADGDDEGDGGEEIDPLDLVDPVAILEKLPKDFYTLIESKKWQERKEGLSALLLLAQNPKIEVGDYAELVRTLRKIIGKDSNVVLVALAGQCLTGLAKGLRTKFSPYAVSCLETVLSKFKEKKTNVLNAMRDATNALFQSTNIESMQEVVIASLNIKNPTIKSETAAFVGRCFCYCTPTILNKKLLKTYTIELLKILNDPDPTARESAAEALGTAMKVVGEKGIEPFIADVEPIKKAKIKEYSEKAEIKVKIVAPKPKSKPPPKPVAKPVRGRGGAAKKPVAKKPVPVVSDDELAEIDHSAEISPVADTKRKEVPTKGAAAKRAKATPKPTTPPKTAVSNSLLQVNTCKQQRIKDEQRLRVLRWDFVTPRPDFINQLKEQMETAKINEQFITNMFHQDFKLHIKCLESLQRDLLTNQEGCVCNLDLILRWLTIRFFDTNPSVIMKAMEYLKQVFTVLSEDQYKMTDHEAYSFLPFLVMKFGDSKDTIRTPAQQIISIICLMYPSSKVSPYILDGLKSKNARQRVVCLDSMTAMIARVGVSVCQPSVGAALKEMAKQIGDRDNTVRNAALNALVQVYHREGEKIYKMIGTIAEKDRCLLEERIRRNPKKEVEQPTVPTRNVAAPAPVVPASGTRLGRVIPTAAVQPPPFVRNARAIPSEAPNVNTRLQIDYDHMERLLADDKKPTDFRPRVQLEEIEDVDSLLSNDQLPARLARFIKPTYTTAVRSKISPRKTNTDDVSEAINAAISDINDSSVTPVVLALSQLDELISSEEKRVHLYPQVDKLLQAITHQYTYVYNIKMADNAQSKDECIRLYRSLTNCLISIFDNKDLGTLVSRDGLHYTIQSVLRILMDPRLSELEDGPKVIRSLNVLVIRMIEKANFTNVFSALLKLLRDSVAEGVDSKFTALVMKCNWKAIRILPTKSSSLHVVDILEQLHHFMVMYPSTTWAHKACNLPLRTIKTVIQKLVQIYGNSIFNHLTKVSHVHGSELQKYILKTATEQKSAPSAVDCGELNDQRKAGQNITPFITSLSDIMQTIGSKDNSQKGIVQLYEFKLKHPETDIDPYLRNASQYLRNYIEKGLKKVELERRPKETNKTAHLEEPLNKSGSSEDKSNVNEMVNQFKAIATEAGFDELYIDSAVNHIYGETTSPK